MFFKAAILREFNQPLDIVELQVPELQPGQVLVRINCAGICGAQIREITGAKGPDPYLPHMLGHEGSGTVEEVGAGVYKVKPGDFVVCHWRKGSGMEAPAPRYTLLQGGDGLIGGGPVATFGEMSVMSENRLTVVPNDIPGDVAALFGCALTTGFGAVINEAQVNPGESVLVIGAGGVGLCAIQGASVAGAFPIVAIDIKEENLRCAFNVGANVFHLPTAIGIQPAEVVIETTGIPDMIHKALELTRPGGRLVLVGQPAIGLPVYFDDFRRHYVGKTIMDSQGGGCFPDRDIPRYLNLYRAGKLRLGAMMVHYDGIDSINKAISDLQNREVSGRCILHMEGND